ncbi:MAG: flgJ [Vampirovibrio sp.]|nr:flgJ [Vampirovibrio sp.]
MNPMDTNLQTGNLQWQGQADASKIQQMQRQFLNPGTADQKKLKKAAQEFEAIFVQQMLDAMDKTIDRENSILSGGSSEQYFRGMLNQEIAKSMTTRQGGSGFGLAESIYRQMSQNMKADTTQTNSNQTGNGIQGTGKTGEVSF